MPTFFQAGKLHHLFDLLRTGTVCFLNINKIPVRVTVGSVGFVFSKSLISCNLFQLEFIMIKFRDVVKKNIVVSICNEL